MCIGDLFAGVQLVELSAANSSETTSLQLQSSMAAVTQFVQGMTVSIVIFQVFLGYQLPLKEFEADFIPPVGCPYRCQISGIRTLGNLLLLVFCPVAGLRL